MSDATTTPTTLTPDQIDFPESLSDATIAATTATELKLKPTQTLAALKLLDEGNTVPFITRYRKEATGGMDEVQIQAVADRADALRTLHQRKRDVLRLIGEQGKLTAELASAITAAATLQAVEDLYLPYRPKRKTRASVARERGLQPLADLILQQARVPGSPEQALRAAAESFVDAAKGVETWEAALAGARDICAETVMEDAGVRGDVRNIYLRESAVTARLTVDAERAAEKDPRGVYRLYYDFSEPIGRMAPHRTLALNRAEREDVLRVAVDVPFERAAPLIHRAYQGDPRSPFAGELETAIGDGYRRLLAPALEREARAELTRQAEEHAINVFATNLRNLLLQPPLRGVPTLALDPGFRTGCKVAVLDENGGYVESATIYPHEPQRRWEEAKATLKALIARHSIGAIAIGNGT
ncbi:MAG TPA: Tex-like N-terminal domain-containing protein, partial [Ktedonobacterales bacterium]